MLLIITGFCKYKRMFRYIGNITTNAYFSYVAICLWINARVLRDKCRRRSFAGGIDQSSNITDKMCTVMLHDLRMQAVQLR